MESITFLQLENEQNQFLNKEISIKGFYYETSSGNPILSNQSNLKTCCLGKKGFSLLLDKNYSIKNSQAITLKGILKKDLSDNCFLTNSEILNSEKINLYSFILIFIILISLSYFFFIFKKGT